MSDSTSQVEKILSLLQGTEETMNQGFELIESLQQETDLLSQLSKEISYDANCFLIQGERQQDTGFLLGKFMSLGILDGSSITRLHLTNQKSEHLEELFTHLPNLKRLIISTKYQRWPKRTSPVSLKTLPDTLATCTKLKEIHIKKHSQLEEIPAVVGTLKNLRKISFEGCALKRLSPCLLELPKLETLNLKGNYALNFIHPSIFQKESLKQINLQSTGVFVRWGKSCLPNDPNVFTKIRYGKNHRIYLPRLSSTYPRRILQQRLEQLYKK